MISVAEVVNDPEFAQPFEISRSTGQWIVGKFQSTAVLVPGYGVIADPTNEEINMVPEGDRAEGVMVFWSSQPMYTTHADGKGGDGSSDILCWRGLKFRVLNVKQFQDYGYYRAIGVRMKAN